MDIELLDLGDESTYDAFHALYLRAHPEVFDEPWNHLEKRSNLTSDTYAQHLVLVGRAGREVVAGAWLSLPLLDNAEKAYLQVFVDPAARRRGHGTQMLDHVERLASEHDRTVAYAEVTWAVDHETAPGVDFARHRGYEVDLLDTVRFLDLPATLPDAPFRDGYRPLAWRRVCPEEHLDDYAELRAQLMAHAPSGEVGIEPEFFDATRVRHEEDIWREHGRIGQTVAALSPDGELVGHTQIVVSQGSEAAYQWDTLVLPEHRGHGLGLALKSAALVEAADLLEGCSRVSTWNAASNAHMIAINDALGYRQVAWGAEMVRHLA